MFYVEPEADSHARIPFDFVDLPMDEGSPKAPALVDLSPESEQLIRKKMQDMMTIAAQRINGGAFDEAWRYLDNARVYREDLEKISNV